MLRLTRNGFAPALPMLALAFAGTLHMGRLGAQTLSDGAVYAGQSGAMGYNGDGDKATSAELFLPQGVALDSKGNLYIADQANNRIRKVAPGTGIITTFAGTGQANLNFTGGGNDDGNQATSVNLTQPPSVAVDGADNVYIYSFPTLPRIQKVTAATGIISTVVPNSVLANFSLALFAIGGISMAVDKGGATIWLAGDGQVLKIDVASGKVTTFSIGGSQHSALALAPNGDLIFLSVTPPANVFGPSIYRMSTATGAITTVYQTMVSTSTGGIPGIFSLCVDSSGNIFFADDGSAANTDALFRIDALSGAVSQVAVALATFSSQGFVANSLAADTAGNLYFSEPDQTVHRLAVTTAQPVPTIAPGGVVPASSSSPTIESGEWVSIYGTNLASGITTWTGNFPTSLGGTSVTINGKAAYLSFVSPGQINLQAPGDAASGPVPVTVTTAAGSTTSTVTLAQFAPSFLLLDAKHVAGIIFRSNGSGAYGGGTYDVIGPTGTSLGYPTVAAKAGDIIELFGTGFGPTTPVVQPGQAFSAAAPTSSAVTLLINGVGVNPSFAGLSGAGLYQINFTLPTGLGTGDFPLMAAVGGAQTQSGIVISLQ